MSSQTLHRRPPAGSWDAVARVDLRRYPLAEEELLLLARHLPVLHGQTAAGAGCGEGDLARYVHDAYGVSVTGYDWSTATLAAARRFPRPRVSFVRHDLNSGPPPGLVHAGLELVVCRQTVGCLADPGAWLHEIRTHWLRPRGLLFLSDVLISEAQARPACGGLTERTIAQITSNWACTVRYDLTGQLVTCFILRNSVI
ncbi:class I SAM-dependent methyltransferase [Streptomyces sp. NPDC001691]|uniref:class I SAM-dependent methyltransferase n=1 Tax=Streptomyces sp. NPDC001691 TaxID=3364600 RepID=UPI0036BB00C2